jgi:hypothetical protein
MTIKKYEYLIRDLPFDLYTDHENLVYLNTPPSNKVLRWKLAIQEYDIKINYIKGELNVVADGLSRLTEELPSTTIRSMDDIDRIQEADNEQSRRLQRQAQKEQIQLRQQRAQREHDEHRQLSQRARDEPLRAQDEPLRAQEEPLRAQNEPRAHNEPNEHEDSQIEITIDSTAASRESVDQHRTNSQLPAPKSIQNRKRGATMTNEVAEFRPVSGGGLSSPFVTSSAASPNDHRRTDEVLQPQMLSDPGIAMSTDRTFTTVESE